MGVTISIRDLEDYFGEKSGIRHLIQKLSDTRLVTTDRKLLPSAENDNATVQFVETVQVTHEAIIRNWKRLEGWLNVNRDFLSWYQEFSNEVSRWQESNENPDLLHRGLLLLETQRWFSKRESEFAPIDKRFITQSISREKRQRQLRNSGILTLAGLLLVALYFAITLAQRNRDLEAQASQALMAFSVIGRNNLIRQTGDLEAEQDLFQRLFLLERSSSEPTELFNRLDTAKASFTPREPLYWNFSADGRWLARGTSDRNVLLQDLQTDNSTLIVGTKRNSQNIWQVAFSANGEIFASPGSSPGSIEIWDMGDLAAPSPLHLLEGLKLGIAQIQSIAISPDARWVAGGGVGNVAGIWDLDNLSKEPTILVENDGTTNQIITIQFSTSSKWLGLRDGNQTLFMWENQDDQWIPIYKN